ncbi:MAG: gliding motility-associated C-terminal domain-containing protein [Bacteroidota bacterium]
MKKGRLSPLYLKFVKCSLCLLLSFSLQGQICNFPFSPSDICANAPLICNLDGFCSRNDAATNSGTPNAFCGQVENNNWVAFIAGSTAFEIQIEVSNCNQGSGLQAQFFSTNNCNNFVAVSNCLDPVNSSGTLTCNNLNIGERYYLMMDGKGGDVCDYAYTLISGEILSPASVSIEQSNPLCAGSTTNINAIGLSSNANLSYNWSSVDGNILSNPTNQNIEVNTAGTYQVEVADGNGCTSSSFIVVEENSLPLITTQTPDILNCESNTTETLVIQVNPPNGVSYQFIWTTANGNILDGFDTANPTVDAPGLYEVTVNNDLGCSQNASIEVFADVNTPVANAGDGGELNCVQSNIELISILSSLGQDFTYQWNTTNGNIVEGENSLNAVVDAPGVYTLIVTNTENGCTATDEAIVTLNDAQPNGAAIRAIQPCFGENNGSIFIDSVFGGTSPFVYSFDSLPYSFINRLHPATIASHQLVIQDAIGCEWSTQIDIVPQAELIVDLGPDQTVPLGCAVELLAQVNYPPASIDTLIWNSAFICSPQCDTSLILLNERTFRVEVKDNNGCTARDEVTYFVQKDRNVYIPNAFSPNADGVNDQFMIFGGKDVRVIQSFAVFNRWGAQVYERRNFQPNDPAFAWDGQLNNQQLNSQVLLYLATVEFIDGRIETYQGDLTLLR